MLDRGKVHRRLATCIETSEGVHSRGCSRQCKQWYANQLSRNDKAAQGRLVAFRALGQTKRSKGESCNDYTTEFKIYLLLYLQVLSICT
jgi:hypothetical protein